MGILNRRRTRDDAPPAAGHLNWMGGRSFELSDPVARLRLAASSCFFGEPMYYHRDEGGSPRTAARARVRPTLGDAELARLRDTLNAVDPRDWRGLGPAALLERAIDEALAADAERTLAEAVRLRVEEHIRTTPQVILVRAANHRAVKGTGLVRRYAKDVIRRADEPATGLAYQLARFGKPVPNALKKAWRDALARFDAYELAKYKMGSREVKTVDVVNVTHPKSAAVDRLARGELTVSGATWEAIVSAKGSNAEAWREALGAMGHMALLRNLRNLNEAGVKPKEFVAKLVAGAPKGQQLPFRYYSAYRAVGDKAPPSLRDGIEACLDISLANLPSFPGRVMSLCDNSGSARSTTTSSLGTMQISTIANLTGVLTGMRSDDGYVGVFGDRLETFSVRRRASAFDQLEQAERLGGRVGGNTENGVWLFWDRAIRAKEHWDYVFVYSDMQAGHGGLYGPDANAYREFRWGETNYIDVAKLVAAYRQRVNPNVLVFLVQIAGYQDTIVPEFYDKTYILGGWGEGLLRFAAAMSGLGAAASPSPAA
jgi:60 kDa SS-A/Ro ribonucleoprotein